MSLLPSARDTRTLPAILRAWIVLDLVLVLLPPLHWWAGTPGNILGIPRVLAYLFGTGLFVALSAVAVHLHTNLRAESDAA